MVILTNTQNKQKRRNFRHLTYTDRLKIEALFNANVNKKVIAAEIGCSLSTVYNELERGKCVINRDWYFIDGYSADIAQQKIDFNRRDGGPGEKIGSRFDVCELLAAWILDGKSPAVCAIQLKQGDYGITLCTNTIYSYIKKGYIPNVTMADCLEGERRKKTKAKPKPRKAVAGTSIERRPPEIYSRKEPGHWEMDCVIGKSSGRRQALLTLTERTTRYEIIMRLDRKDAASVVRALDKIEKTLGGSEFRRIFKSITVDNGCEFADARGLEHSRNGKRRTQVYYCHPYCSSERGTNERHNRIIRRFFPKGQSLWSITQEDCDRVADFMNSYPRRILGWQTPSALFRFHFFDEPLQKSEEQKKNFLICS